MNKKSFNGVKAGSKFGRWTILNPICHKNREKCLCLCRCGTIKTVWRSHVLTNRSKSCGCLCVERTKECLTTHGESQIRNCSTEYTIWQGIKLRCLCKTNKGYPNYGGRGIKMHPKWIKSYESFLSYVGRRPKPGMSLGRINNDGHYEPGNVRWETQKQQARNMRTNRMITINGKTKSLAEWCDILNVTYGKTQLRLNRGWSPEKAFDIEKFCDEKEK